MTIRKLTPSEFARAIRLGHGRALLHIVEYRDQGIEQAIEDAILNCYVYDWQVEGTRAFWIFDLVAATGRIKFYAKRVIERFTGEEFSEADIAQQIQISWQFFKSGFPEFRKIAFEKYSALLKLGTNEAECGCMLTMMAGEFGIRFVAGLIGKAPGEIDDHDCSLLLDHAEGALSEIGQTESLRSLAEIDPDINRFLEASARDKEYQNSAPPPRPPLHTFEEILEKIERREHAPSGLWYRAAARHISDREAQQLYRMFEKTDEPWKQLAYLQMFALRTIPEISDKVLRLTISADHHTAKAAQNAMAKVEHPIVRETAIAFLTSGEEEKVVAGFKLLKHNYKLGDGELLKKALRGVHDETKIHAVGSEIMAIGQINKSTEIIELLLWCYENNPESWCRRSSLEDLVERNACPADILFESQWDCAESTQLFARAIVAREEIEQATQ